MPQDKVLFRYCQNALKVLQTQYHATQLLQHNSTAGSTREQLIKDFLVNHLPELITVVSGQIFDANDSYSRQQDIVLVLKSVARLPFASGNDLIFQDGVVATVEIKTTLNTSVLQTVGENIRSVRALVSSAGGSAQLGVTHSWPPHKILTAIVTYEAASDATLSTALAALPVDAKPDLVLDLNGGLHIRNHGLLVPQIGAVEYLYEPSAARGFMVFLIFLIEITGTISARGVMWRRYCS